MKKLSIILVLFACFAVYPHRTFAQVDLLNKGKNLLKKKENNQNQTNNQNQNQNQTNNQNQNQNQNNQQPTYSSDDCAFYAKNVQKNIDAIEYQDGKGDNCSIQ